MATLPQLIEEDVQQLGKILGELLTSTEATTALVIDKGGFLIHSHGDADQFDLTTIAALASGAYMANQTIANLVHEDNFNSVYQAGEKFSMFVVNVDEYCMLVVIFKAALSVGAIKYFATRTTARIAAQLAKAQERDPAGGLDLSVLNVADTSKVFRKKRSASQSEK
jgi:predicted regulator of Ras-like GTPase activity (Roadblock/LC7/MglB family)